MFTQFKDPKFFIMLIEVVAGVIAGNMAYRVAGAHIPESFGGTNKTKLTNNQTKNLLYILYDIVFLILALDIICFIIFLNKIS